MERSKFEVGDVVQQADGGTRMKVESIDRTDGRITCSWTRGPGLHRKKFVAEALVRSNGAMLVERSS
jgi:uncharacterized protein YodC (DUF2158 family)